MKLGHRQGKIYEIYKYKLTLKKKILYSMASIRKTVTNNIKIN